jgi:hypothetical protein
MPIGMMFHPHFRRGCVDASAQQNAVEQRVLAALARESLNTNAPDRTSPHQRE